MNIHLNPALLFLLVALSPCIAFMPQTAFFAAPVFPSQEQYQPGAPHLLILL
jgi:hypothetical protein